MTLLKNYLFSGVGVAKSATVIFGLVVSIIGLRSHFESAWLQYDFHKVCRLHQDQASCPDIVMERFYAAIVITCTIVSAIGLSLSAFFINPHKLLFWILDIAYHGAAAVLLFTGAILYIVSAVKISQHPMMITDNDLPPHVLKLRDTSVLLGTQKIIAGVLTILESVVYIVTMRLIKRARSRATGPAPDDLCSIEHEQIEQQ